MKKFLGILAIAGTLAACDNAANSEQRTKDSLDSVENAKKAMIDSTAEQRKDSIEQNIEAKKDMVDTMNRMVDTSNN